MCALIGGRALCLYHLEEPSLWLPPIALSPAAQKSAARTHKARKFLVFLRTIRPALLDAEFPPTLAQSSRPAPGGQAPVAVGWLAVATLLQASGHVGARDAVELRGLNQTTQHGHTDSS